MKKSLALAVTTAAFVAVPAGTALAYHCGVADKPTGAGSATEADIKQAGKSSNTVLPGAFISFDGETDVLRRGPALRFPIAVGTGMLPDQPIVNGSAEHGVVDMYPEHGEG